MLLLTITGVNNETKPKTCYYLQHGRTETQRESVWRRVFDNVLLTPHTTELEKLHVEARVKTQITTAILLIPSIRR